MSRKKNKKITDSARGEDCQVRIEGHCNFNFKTTIFAHLNGGGMGFKVNDIHGAYCCSGCHDVVDSRVTTCWTRNQLLAWFYEGMVRTQLILLEKGLIKA
jgi:hypothetical protein